MFKIDYFPNEILNYSRRYLAPFCIYLRAPINTTIDTIYSISRQFSFEKSDGPDDSNIQAAHVQ